MRSIALILVLLALTIGAGREARQSQSQPQLQPPRKNQPLPPSKSRLYRLSAFALAWILGLATAAQTIVALWGPFWPTFPEFAPGATDISSPFDVPFSVTNRSMVFPLENIQISCYIPHLLTTDDVKFDNDLLVGMPETTIDVDTTQSFTCFFPFKLAGTIKTASLRMVVNMKRWPWSTPRMFDHWFFTWNSKANPPRWVVGTDIGNP